MQQSWSNDGTFPSIHNIKKQSVSFNASSFAEPSFVSTSSSTRKLKASALASERWNVQKLQTELDDKMMNFYTSQVSKCRKTEDTMNQRAERLYNAILQEVKWSNPPIPHVHINLILEYCRHLIASGSSTLFPKEMDLRTWNAKVKGTPLEKIIFKVKDMYNKLFRIIAKRDTDMINLQNHLLSSSETLKVKNDSTLRWLMEKNQGKKDEYFTIWYLAKTNRLRVLQVLLSSATKMKDYGEEGINATDPDFGMTALHYACRESHTDIIHYLLGENADVNIVAPDGRTALHFAAAYSTREVCLALLGAGADSQQRDYFQNIPLDLALQNNNKKTIATLQHWEELMVGFPDYDDDGQQLFLLNQQPSMMTTSVRLLQLPRPGETAFDRNDLLDVDNVEKEAIMPVEYEPVSGEIFQRMSRDLQFLAQRLNGYNPYLHAINNSAFGMVVTSHLRNSSSFVLNSSTYGGADPLQAVGQSTFTSVAGDGKKSILAEIRLCTKYFASCVQENLLDEALRALKRRWLAAKRLYGLITEEKQVEQFHVQGIVTRQVENEENNDTISELPFDDEPHLDNDEEHIQAIKAEEETQPLVQEQYIVEENKHFELEKITNDFLSSFTTITYLPPTPAASVAVATQQEAEDLFPPVTHVSEKIFVEDEAFLLLSDAEKQKKKDAAAIIQQILDRYAVQEHVTRLQEYAWRYENIEQLDHYTQYSSTASLADSSMTLASTELSIHRYKPNYSLENHVENYAMSLAQELVEVLLVRKKYDQALLVLEDSLRLKDGVLITARLRCLFQLCDVVIYVIDRWDKQQNKFAQIYNRWKELLSLPPLSSRKGPMAGIFSMNQTSFVLDDLGSISLPLLEAPSTAVLLSFLTESEAKLKTNDPLYVELLERCIDAAQEAIDLASVMSARQLMEPISIAQAMGFLGQARERLGRYIEAYEAMEEGSLLATRISYGSQTAIELMLEALRLYVKYFLKTEEHCQIVAHKSAEINRMIAAYAPDQFTVNAELWLRKSVELLAIATNTIRDPFVQIKDMSTDVKVIKRDEKQIRKALKKKIKYLE